MMNYFYNWFKKQELQPEMLYFSGMNKKLLQLEAHLAKASNGPILQQYAIQMIQQVNREIKELKKYIDEITIYVVFLGTTSAGKSTFINSLLGQQLMPAKNQECTQQILFITHNKKLMINNKPFNNLDQASQYLSELQKNDRFDVVNIQTSSVFHQQLPKDLQSRIVFVDTYPGIKLREQQKLKEHFLEIDNRVGNHHRINIWISNYTTFDSDKELQNQILQIYQPKSDSVNNSKGKSFLSAVIQDQDMTQAKSFFVEDDSEEMQESSQLKQEQKLAPLLFILNKYDERRQSEDSAVELTIKQISKTIGSESLIYKISALRSLRYQIMNYGSKQAIDKFVQSYFVDYRDVELFQTQEECRQHCEQKIKNNHNLLQSQDYSQFQNMLVCLIKQQINLGFYGEQLNYIGQSLVLMDLVLNPQCIRLEEKKMEQLKEFTSKFIDQQMKIYLEWISKFCAEATSSIEKIIQTQKQRLIQVDPSIVISFACKETINVFAELDEKINELNRKTKKNIMDKLTSIFEPIPPLFGSVQIVGPVNKTLDGCLRLYELLSDTQIYEIEKQSFEQYSIDLQRTLGVQINTLQKSVGIATTGLSLVTFLGRRFIMSTALCSPVFAAVGIGLLSIDLDMIFGKKWYSQQVVEQSLTQWKGSLITQITNMHNNYASIHQQTLNSLKSLLKSLME